MNSDKEKEERIEEHRIDMPVMMDVGEEVNIRIKMTSELAKNLVDAKKLANRDQLYVNSSKVVKVEWVKKLVDLEATMKKLGEDFRVEKKYLDLMKDDKGKWDRKFQKFQENIDEVSNDLVTQKANLLRKGDKAEWEDNFQRLQRTTDTVSGDLKIQKANLLTKGDKAEWEENFQTLQRTMDTVSGDLKIQEANLLTKGDKAEWEENFQTLQRTMDTVSGDLKIQEANLLMKGDKAEWEGKFIVLEGNVKKLEAELGTHTAAAAVLKEVQNLKRRATSAFTILIYGVPIFILLYTVMHQLVSVDCKNFGFNIGVIVSSLLCALPLVWITILKMLNIRNSLEKVKPLITRLNSVTGQGGKSNDVKDGEGDGSNETIGSRNPNNLDNPLQTPFLSQSEDGEGGSHLEDVERGSQTERAEHGSEAECAEHGSEAERAERASEAERGEPKGSNETNVSRQLDDISYEQLLSSMSLIQTFTRDYVVPAVVLGLFPIIYGSALTILVLKTCGKSLKVADMLFE